MVDPILSLSEPQLRRILAAISTQQPQWWPVASVFVSSLLAMIVGILLDRFRAWRDRIKATRDKQEHEIRQINAVISGLTFDIERLLHIASQNILPHYRDAQAVDSQIVANFDNDQHVRSIVVSLNKHSALFMTCPELCLIEYDFAKELPFLIERDPEMVKHSGWLVGGAREIKDVTARRNRNIEDAFSLTGVRDGPENLNSFKIVVRSQASIAKTECVVAEQLFRVLIKLATDLVAINQSYEIQAKKSQFIVPDALNKTVNELKEITDKIPIRS